MHDFIFFIRESFIGMKRFGVMTFISIATVTVSLIVFGVFLLVILNLNNVSSMLSTQLEIRVFLKPTLSVKEVQVFYDKMRRIKGVDTITFVDRDVAWTDFKKNFNHLALDKTVRDNPLPHSFNVQLLKKQSLKPVVTYMERFDYYVEEIVYGGKIAQRVEQFNQFAKGAGLLLVSLLGCSTLLIIVNTIRLTVLARHEEITIMRLVGATNRFISWPFLIEGLIIGVVGALASILLLKFGYGFIGLKIQSSVPFFPLVVEPTALLWIYIIVGLVGTVLGGIGAYISVSKSLKNLV